MNSSNPRAVWYCSIDGVDHGPVTAEQLKAWAVAGKLLENHVVWKDGNPSRVPARKVRGLFDSPKQSGAAEAGPANSPSCDLDPAVRDVFISCSSNDKPAADAICATLERDRIRCWIAPRDVLPGAPYGEAIIDGINVSRLMVVVLSAASNSSPQVLREVERAVSKGIPVIPFRIEDVTPSKSMEYFLSTPHWLDALTPPLESHIEHLSRVVRTVLAPRRPPPPPQVGGKALDLPTLATRHPSRSHTMTLVLASFVGLTSIAFVCWKSNWFQFDAANRGSPAADGPVQGTMVHDLGPKSYSYTVQVQFESPAGMKLYWLIKAGESTGTTPPLQLPTSNVRDRPKVGPWRFSDSCLEAPASYNFNSGGRYRLKFTNIPGHVGVDLYPSLEVRHSVTGDQAGMLSSGTIPIGLSDDDILAVENGAEVVKVWYLNPAGQIVEFSAPLNRTSDPIIEASRLGTPLVIFRMNNIDLENPNTPPTEYP